MEQRLIDADMLTSRSKMVTIRYGKGCIKEVPAVLCEDIENAPTIEAEPVRHGKWIIRDNPETGWYSIICSACGEDVTSTAPVIGFFPNAKVSWDYCPECGAIMDKE